MQFICSEHCLNSVKMYVKWQLYDACSGLFMKLSSRLLIEDRTLSAQVLLNLLNELRKRDKM